MSENLEELSNRGRRRIDESRRLAWETMILNPDDAVNVLAGAIRQRDLAERLALFLALEAWGKTYQIRAEEALILDKEQGSMHDIPAANVEVRAFFTWFNEHWPWVTSQMELRASGPRGDLQDYLAAGGWKDAEDLFSRSEAASGERATRERAEWEGREYTWRGMLEEADLDMPFEWWEKCALQPALLYKVLLHPHAPLTRLLTGHKDYEDARQEWENENWWEEVARSKFANLKGVVSGGSLSAAADALGVHPAMSTAGLRVLRRSRSIRQERNFWSSGDIDWNEARALVEAGAGRPEGTLEGIDAIEVGMGASFNPGQMPPDLMWILARHPEPRVRCALARRMDLSGRIQVTLASDSEASVVAEIARNPSTCVEAARAIAADPQNGVAAACFFMRETWAEEGPSLLRQVCLIEDVPAVVLQRVAHYSKCHIGGELLADLMASKSREVREWAIGEARKQATKP